MKKLLSVVLAAMMAVSVFAVSMMPAFAADVMSPTASTAESKKPTLEVNGVPTETDINYSPDKDNTSTITFTYTGEGTLKGWEENLADLGLSEGTDYTAVMNADGTFTITFISAQANEVWRSGDVVVNAIVDFGSETTKATTKKNSSSKAPATGISSSIVAGSVAVAFAGAAVLAATKKKDAE